LVHVEHVMNIQQNWYQVDAYIWKKTT